MDTNKILSADLLDLVFDNRNKEYGAYELRKSYHTRITKSLIFTGVFVSLVFTGVVLANKIKPTEAKPLKIIEGVVIRSLTPEEKEPDPIPEPPKKIEQPEIRTEQFTEIKIKPDDEVVTPPPAQTDLTNAIIDVAKKDGEDYEGLVKPSDLDDRKEIIEAPKPKEPEILTIVQVEAKFDGNWEKFLLRNLNPQTPVEHEAPAGNYTVWVQFVVDIDGSISDIKSLTKLGYGLEEEAIRVLRKSKKWDPAIQDGRPVKAYRKQAITFQVMTEE